MPLKSPLTPLHSALTAYERAWLTDLPGAIATRAGRWIDGQRDALRRFQDLATAHPDCCERTTLPGHITASALVVTPDLSAGLLALHRKLGKWLQLGGHADGDPSPREVALREVEEESGLSRVRVLSAPWSVASATAVPFDLDIHEIPARRSEPTHLHFDVRYLILAEEPSATRLSDESLELRWLALDSAGDDWEPSLRRLFDKALLIRDIESIA